MIFRKHTFTNLVLLAAMAAPVLSQAADTAAFSAEQQAQIGKIAEDYFTANPEKLGEAISIYLANHPEFLVAASENLRQNQQLAAQKLKEMEQAQKAAQK